MNNKGVLLVTANVGSIFEDERLMEEWIRHFAQAVTTCGPRFLALHCQEVGGKHEKRVSTDRFFGSLLQSLPQFPSARIFLDSDPNAFTALGSVYLCRDSDVSIWHFEQKAFLAVNDQVVLSADAHTVQKCKFPPSVSPDAPKARKGFLRTRWRLRDLTLDLVNVHLFHDACNLRACQQFAVIRRLALEWTLERVFDEEVPLFLFGDFNFRLDARAFIERFTDRERKARDDQLLFCDAEDELVLSVGRKTFDFRDKELFRCQWQSLRNLDKELQPFADSLYELPISFQPSYPFGEDLTSGRNYLTTRCPAWCDRILLNRRALSLVKDAHYWLMGASQPMGDHKPIALNAKLSGARYVMTTRGVFRETTL